MKNTIAIACAISLCISHITIYAQQSSTVCGLGISSIDPSCTIHIHDNSLNLPSFVTDYLVQSEVQIIVDCDDNTEKIRCSAVLLNNNTNANDNEVLILTARHCIHKNSWVDDLTNFNTGLGPLVDLSNSAIVFNVSKPNPNNSYIISNYDKFYVNTSFELIAESPVGDIAY